MCGRCSFWQTATRSTERQVQIFEVRFAQQQVKISTSPFFKDFLSSRASSKVVAMEVLHFFGTVPLVAKVCPKCVGGDYSIGVPVIPAPILIEQHKTWCSVAKCNNSGGMFVEHVHLSSQYWIQRGN
jgi:hypothetical protein